ncbi:cucumber peeling cupredoxin-like [Pistacia vera]|uniref:cucumber peeling cupredoxin-like n=1 Tax=Pistacia vera TaxID=55513 RepID=UPI001263557E|nr:cucumber peeling cupredoxin-like [Pistacia vera]
MARFMSLAFVGVIAVALLQCAAAATDHVVGDGEGWKVPSTTNVYENWAAGKTFMVGDILTFNFVTNEHDVLEVTKESYHACTDSNPVGNKTNVGPAKINLKSAGDKYYICTIGRHCANGQKLAIKVTSADACSPTSGPSASTPPPPSGAGGAPGPDSSSSISLASVLLSMFAVVIGFLF